MLEKIKDIDTDLLLYLNGLGTETWDGFWLFMTYTLTSVPLYLFILFLVYRYYGLKKMAITLLFVVILITLTDQMANMFKYGFGRLRPCYNEQIMHLVRLVKPTCGGKYSFFSGHASNSMSVAMFFSLLIGKHVKWIPYFLITWALLVGYSRIYIGVHFPFDVLFGFLVGVVLGTTVYKLMKLFLKKFISKTTITQ
ncbi:phosphatase PAP2 family protein [Urechidicola croceus]|uniref:Phosphatase PAP2 family protein n=1 Tax=Urechidicola croceus TaxID=1850246 RepID=A0A1D8P5X5_9FLAO|nr:phosphatase PAP2 family protein [Urechidicola croceus]AOW19965.1 phosphatase PAP2 family protein [Urechidicola croceus]